MNRVYKIDNLKSAFSLIELSIVLIIIGLLVAGVTGGKSLIESAKTRALMNEIRGYKQAVNTFYVANDRFPGDANKDGLIDGYDDGFYDFPAPYNENVQDMFIQAPWIDLYLDGIIDFKVNPDRLGEIHLQLRTPEELVAPHSKVFPDFVYDITGGTQLCGGRFKDDVSYNKRETLNCLIFVKDYENVTARDIKIFQNIDSKMDDAKSDTGNIVADCADKYDDLDDGRCNYLTILLNFN